LFKLNSRKVEGKRAFNYIFLLQNVANVTTKAEFPSWSLPY